jgi:hypothetical protein
MLRLLRLGLALAVVAAAAAVPAWADNGNAPTTLSFFSGGNGAHADWFATDDQPPGDTDRQAVRLITTNGAPTFAKGYAGILFHHVTGIPAAAFPDSDFWNEAPAGPTLGSPRLVVAFQDALGNYTGDAELDQNARTGTWEHVSDVDDYPNSGWDIHSATCPYAYHQKWSAAQSCHSGEFVMSAYIVADAYDMYQLIDDMTVNGKHFSSASDNGNGHNDAAGPDATTDTSLLPPLFLLP